MSMIKWLFDATRPEAVWYIAAVIGISIIILYILQTRKLRIREGIYLVKSHSR